MNLRWIWLGHLRGLWQRRTRTLLSVIAVGAGAALVVGVVVSDHSIKTSLDEFEANVTLGAPLRVEGPTDHGGLDTSVLPAVAATPGVRAAVPLIFTVTQAVDSRGDESLVPVLGVDCSIEAIVGAFGCDPAAMATANETPVLGETLKRRLGPHGALRTNLGEIATGGAPTVEQLAQVNDGSIAVFALPVSQRHFVRPNGLDAILVLPADGVSIRSLSERLRDVVGDNNHVFDTTTPLGGAGFAAVTSILTPFLFLISLIGLVIGAQLVRNTVDLSLEERRRELATTGALGARPRAIVAGIVAESVVIGALGSALAIAGGVVIATAFVGRLSEELAKSSGLAAAISTPPLAVVLGVVVAIGVSVIASIGPARRASRLDLVAELSGRGRFESDRAASPRGLVVTVALVVVTSAAGWLGHRGGALDSWQPPLSVLALVGSVIVGYALSVQLAPRLLSILQRAPVFATGPGRVALTNILRARRRTTSIAIAITAPVFFSTMFGGIAPGMADAARGLAKGTNHDSVYVSTLPSNNSSNIDAKVTPDMQTALGAVSGVAAVHRQYFSSANDPALGPFALEGFEGAGPRHRVHRGRQPAEAFARGEVMIGPALARANRLAPGDTVTVAAKVGPRQPFVVGGIWASPNNLGRSVTMRAEQLFALVGPKPAESVALMTQSGVSAEELARRVIAAGISDRLRVMTTDQLADDFSREFLKLASPFDALRTSLVVVALVATASTLVLAAAQRRRDNATLAALGMSPEDLARSTVIETVVTALAVTALATVCAQLSLVNFGWASALLTGLGIPYRISAGPILSAALVTSAIALAGALVPAWRTARTNVMEALRTA